VTHLYNRSLLTEVSETELFTLLDEALWWLEKNEARTISDHLRDALKTRLRFRKAFLGAVSKDLGIIKDPSTIEWETCAKHLQLIGDSHCLGKPVERSFSVKIQRKLASTVPPRPMVNISFENALMHLKRLCQDGTDLVAVLDFCGSNDLLVGRFSSIRSPVNLTRLNRPSYGHSSRGSPNLQSTYGPYSKRSCAVRT
jgi:hypothetical protein